MSRGFIIPIGGAEEKMRDAEILRRFVNLCGGREAHIAVIPTASELEGTGPRYRAIFRDLGAREVSVLPFNDRADGSHGEWLETLRAADGVFMTGGNQLRLSTNLGGTPASDLLREGNARGQHIAGTSAGAAFLSEHMIAFGDEGSSPRSDMVTLAPGLGLTKMMVVDQHFRQRDRLGRLLTALAYNPRPIGVGLDEDTAGFLGPDDVLEVAGSGALTVVDPSEISYSSMDSARRSEPVCLLDVRLHILIDSATYNIRTRRPAAPGAAHRREAS